MSSSSGATGTFVSVHRDHGPASQTATAPEPDHLTGHEYDGIAEYDNPTPGWWHIIFFVTIFFSAIYFVFWGGSDWAWTIEDSWKSAQTAEYKKIFSEVGELKNDEATLHKMMADPKFMAIAEGNFQAICANCHARDGGGLVGPNMCDDSYKNVKKLTDLFDVITKGAAAGAMPAQSATLTQNDRVLLAAYVAKLRGSRPASPKPAEGEVIPPWPAASTAPAEAPTKK